VVDDFDDFVDEGLDSEVVLGALAGAGGDALAGSEVEVGVAVSEEEAPEGLAVVLAPRLSFL
jgi:hypothetical protein